MGYLSESVYVSGMHVHVCVCVSVYVIHWTVMRHDNVRAIEFHIEKNNTNCIVSVLVRPLSVFSLSLSFPISPPPPSLPSFPLFLSLFSIF